MTLEHQLGRTEEKEDHLGGGHRVGGGLPGEEMTPETDGVHQEDENVQTRPADKEKGDIRAAGHLKTGVVDEIAEKGESPSLLLDQESIIEIME